MDKFQLVKDVLFSTVYQLDCEEYDATLEMIKSGKPKDKDKRLKRLSDFAEAIRDMICDAILGDEYEAYVRKCEEDAYLEKVKSDREGVV